MIIHVFARVQILWLEALLHLLLEYDLPIDVGTTPLFDLKKPSFIFINDRVVLIQCYCSGCRLVL